MNPAWISRHLSTVMVPPRERLPMWREVFGQAIAKLDIEATGDALFHAEGTLCALPGAAYASVHASPVRIARTRGLIAADPADMLYLITADAPLAISQGGHDHMLAAGDAIFLRGSEVSRINSSLRSRFTNIAVAFDDLRPVHAGADDLAMRVVSRHNDLLGLLHAYVHILHPLSATSEAAATLAAGHIRDLISAIAAAQDESPPSTERSGVRAARLRAIKADIAVRLRDPELNITGVAERAGISPRYVRRLFQEEESRFSVHLLERRLDRAHHMLLHPGQTPRTIAAIAYACGFGDLSYFNRTFRRRFGMTPSDLRVSGF